MDKVSKVKVALLIPTYNAGDRWIEVLRSINKQTVACDVKMIVDSGSTDKTVELASVEGFDVTLIAQSEFNHGATRQMMADKANADICVFLTQDAILDSADSIAQLINAFKDPEIGLAYGRQLPHKGAGAQESHARFFNYPDKIAVRSFKDKDRLGFKVFFCSNSFAAYRTVALNSAGGFPSESIMGEDAITAAKLLMQGYKIAYIPGATVRHSHSYSLSEEFKRYFDTRVFHEQHKWLIETYGAPTGEGFRFLKSEFFFIAQHEPTALPRVILSIFAKYMGYFSGKFYKRIPSGWIGKFSMHHRYWRGRIA